MLTQVVGTYGALQEKLDATSVLPAPLYRAICGYGQSGRVRTTPLDGSPSLLYFEAMIACGATPLSTQRSRAAAYSCAGPLGSLAALRSHSARDLRRNATSPVQTVA